MSGSEFIVHRLRAKPVEYTVTIAHFVRAGEWVMSASVKDVGDDTENCLRVADDLEVVAKWLREDYGGAPPPEGEETAQADLIPPLIETGGSLSFDPRIVGDAPADSAKSD